MHVARVVRGAAVAAVLAGCGLTEPDGPGAMPAQPSAAPRFAAALSSYFPPPETGGGWRKPADPTATLALGMDPGKLDALGSYVTSLPYEHYNTGVTGYNETDKAALVIKNGWLAGEYYNQPSAATDVYYLASNGKTFAIMLLGRLQLDYPALGIGPESRLYDERWLPEGQPLSDPRKAATRSQEPRAELSGV